MDNGVNLTGELVEIGRLEGEGGDDCARIRRADGSHVTIRGLRADEVQGMASFFLDRVTVTIAGAA